jgi:hypothetical protein
MLHGGQREILTVFSSAVDAYATPPTSSGHGPESVDLSEPFANAVPTRENAAQFLSLSFASSIRLVLMHSSFGLRPRL